MKSVSNEKSLNSKTKDERIILFDGICNLCAAVVQFVIKRDPQGRFLFASLQSATGQRLLKGFNLPQQDFDSFVLVEDKRVYLKSTAGLRVVRQFRGFWPILSLLLVIPRFIRDYVYNFIARNRYDWFGKQEKCPLPSPDLASRFLE